MRAGLMTTAGEQLTLRRLLFLVAVVLALLAGVGCRKPGADGVRLKQVNDALLSAGFKLDSFHPVDATRFAAQKCATGTLNGVETLVCEYATLEAEALGRRAGEDWIAQAVTGTVLVNGYTLLALADRAKADPNGRTIHKIAQTYQNTR